MNRRRATQEGPAAQPVDLAALRYERLEHLYELSKLFATFENVTDTLDPALRIVARTLPLRSAILSVAEGDGSRVSIWAAENQSPQQLRAARAHAERTFTYLIGAVPTDLNLSDQAGKTQLPPYRARAPAPPNRFIVIPLVVAHRQPFGALQVEAVTPFDRTDLSFVNALANQLAVALERDRWWEADIALRKRAEERRITAERRGVTAERDRRLADRSRNEYQALAEANASLYEDAQRAVAVREQILAIVSHDLRNPLATILLATTLMGPADPQAERRKDLPVVISKVERAAQRMVRLIDDLLDFSSIESGNLAVKRTWQDPSAILDEAIASLQTLALAKRLTLTALTQPVLPVVSCDRDRVLQVLFNVVGNAIKITPAGGQITLTLEHQPGQLLFKVADTGPGISEEDAKHLFDRYWRSEKAHYKGNGLGLAIAKGIVATHGGRIWVESVLGRGATFCFTVPLAEPLGTPSAATADTASLQPGPGAGGGSSRRSW